jgi:signal transduction histidine kinase
LERRDDDVILLIADDGLGFDPAAIVSSYSESGLGLVGMTERAALIGGKVEIETAPGAGTTIYVRVPVDGVSTET